MRSVAYPISSFPAHQREESAPPRSVTGALSLSATAAGAPAPAALFCPHCGADVNARDEETFDDAGHFVIAGDRRTHLGPRRWQILSILRRSIGQFVPNARIEEIVWANANEYPSVNCLRVNVHGIRHALKGTPYRIVSAYYEGYKLERIS